MARERSSNGSTDAEGQGKTEFWLPPPSAVFRSRVMVADDGRSPCGDPFESGIQIFHDHDYPYRTAAEQLGTEIKVLQGIVAARFGKGSVSYDIGISAPPRWRENLTASRKGTNMNRSASSSCNLGFRTNGRSSFGTCAERRCGEVSGCAPQSSLPIRVCLSLMCIALKLPTTSLLVPVRYVQYLVALDYDVRHMDEGIELRHLRCVAAEPISRDWSFVELTLIRQQSRYFDTRHCSPLKPPFFRLRNE
jgi:hypothetical protein